MMKKIFTILATFLVATAAMPAEHTVGYCSGEISTLGTVSVEGKTWVSGAMYLPPSMLEPYKDGKITGLRAGLASKLNVDTLKLWVRTDLNGENLVEYTVAKKTDPKLAKGWNEVTFPSPYAFDLEQGLYVGYSYHQKGAAGAFSVVGSQMENAFFAQLGSDAEWADLSKTGILSVEAVIDADVAINYDLALLSAYVCPDSDPAYNRVAATVKNNGTNPINEFTLSTLYSDAEEAYEDRFDQALQPGEKATVTYLIPTKGIDYEGDIFVKILNLGENIDEITGNNSLTAGFSLMKKVLVEEFTTELCGNCPRVAGYLHSLLEMEEYKDCVIALCHHSGYYTDDFTLPIDEEYATFFKISGAPYMMFDRYPLYDGGTTIAICPDKDAIQSAFDNLLLREAHVSVGLTASFDESSDMLLVNVSGERNQAVGSNERIMVYVVENNVNPSPRGQASGGDDYLHQHVIRAYNGSWGESINWTGNTYDMQFSFEISPEWKRNDMQIIAAVGNYDDVNYLNCAIDNCEQIRFPDISGVEDLSIDSQIVEIEYYSLDGKRVNGIPTVSGMYIVRNISAAGEVRTSKTIIR